MERDESQLVADIMTRVVRWAALYDQRATSVERSEMVALVNRIQSKETEQAPFDSRDIYLMSKAT